MGVAPRKRVVTVRIGVSGWRYAPWRGVFYPPGLAQHAELRYVASRLSSIEINGSFYSLQTPASYARWYEETPDDFLFAVKGPRFITHMKRLREPALPLANFFASGVLNLRHKLGPILWQLPESVRYERERLRTFLELLPSSTSAALALARRRDRALMNGRARLAIDEDRPLRHALEIRSDTFLNDELVQLLRERSVALVVAETAGRFPMPADVTADFMYLRLHGDQELYRSGYGDAALERWARRITLWQRGDEPGDMAKIDPTAAPRRARDVYCYFDNTDAKLRAPFDAQSLAEKLLVLPSRHERPGGGELAGGQRGSDRALRAGAGHELRAARALASRDRAADRAR
jgi:uncharacterized protein YecE (DUF72 family)